MHSLKKTSNCKIEIFFLGNFRESACIHPVHLCEQNLFSIKEKELLLNSCVPGFVDSNTKDRSQKAILQCILCIWSRALSNHLPSFEEMSSSH